MLKLTLFGSLFLAQAFLVQRTRFLSVETKLSSGKQAITKTFKKKELGISYVVFSYKSGPIENPLMQVDNVEVIDYKKA